MNDLLTRACALLQQHANKAETLSYRDFAIKLGITQPPVIAQVSQLLEQMIDEDAANRRPILAALVVQKRGDVPRAGFFEKIYHAGLSAQILTGGKAIEWHQQELKKLQAQFAMQAQ